MTVSSAASYNPEAEPVYHELLRKAKPFAQRSDRLGVATVLTDWLIIVCCAMTELVRPLLHGPAAALLYLLAVVVIASRFRGLENLVHEASHKNLFRTTAWNERLEVFFAVPVFRSVREYRWWHLIHHRHLGDQHRDPDIQRYIRLGIHELPDRYAWIMVSRPLLGYHTLEYLRTTFVDFWMKPDSRRTKFAFWGLAALFVSITQPWEFLVRYWVIPFFVVLPVLRFWAEAAEHSALDLNHEVASSRNNIGVLHRWLLHPHDDGFHETHHLYPSIPWYLLSEANRALMNEPYYADFCVSSHTVLSTFQQMKAPTVLKSKAG